MTFNRTTLGDSIASSRETLYHLSTAREPAWGRDLAQSLQVHSLYSASFFFKILSSILGSFLKFCFCCRPMEYLFKSTLYAYPPSKSFITLNLIYVIKVGFFNDGVQGDFSSPQSKYQCQPNKTKQTKKANG